MLSILLGILILALVTSVSNFWVALLTLGVLAVTAGLFTAGAKDA